MVHKVTVKLQRFKGAGSVLAFRLSPIGSQTLGLLSLFVAWWREQILSTKSKLWFLKQDDGRNP